MSESGTAVALVEQAAAMKVNLPAIAAERGIDGPLWSVLKNSIYRGASDDMILVVTDYCRARKLDPLKKPVHIVTVWDNNARQNVETIWEGIASLRTTAMRTREYAGRDASDFGKDISETWTGKSGDVTVAFPEWCQVTVFRIIGGEKCAFPGPRVYWLEAYASVRGGCPNSMWAKRPRGQLDKCAEAAALRAAFPEEIGGDPTAEEMDGQTINGPAIGPDNAVDITPQSEPGPAEASTLDNFAGPAPAPATDENGEPEIPPCLDRREPPAETPPPAAIVILVLTDPAGGTTSDYKRGGSWLSAFEKMLTAANSPESARDVWAANVDTFLSIQSKTAGNPAAVEKCEGISTLAHNLINPPPDDNDAPAPPADADDLY